MTSICWCYLKKFYRYWFNEGVNYAKNQFDKDVKTLNNHTRVGSEYVYESLEISVSANVMHHINNKVPGYKMSSLVCYCDNR